MNENQSRYGIMNELNEKKIARKNQLSKLEQETDNLVFSAEKNINAMKKELSDKENNYKYEHQVWTRDAEVRLKLMKADHKRKEEALEKDIIDRNDNYVSEFEKFKEEKTAQIEKEEETLERFKDNRKREIDNLTEIIKEIDNSIEDLKEMSKEQTK